MGALKGMVPISASLVLVLGATAVLWRLGLDTDHAQRLIYLYLFPLVLIAALYNGRAALFGTFIAVACADYFLQEPLYSFANDNPREYGDLFCFALLPVIAIKCVRALAQPQRVAATSRVTAVKLPRL